jgi:hypothetical protein
LRTLSSLCYTFGLAINGLTRTLLSFFYSENILSENQDVQDVLRHIIVTVENKRAHRSKKAKKPINTTMGYALADTATLEALLQAPHFNMGYFRDRFETLIRRCDRLVFGKKSSARPTPKNEANVRVTRSSAAKQTAPVRKKVILSEDGDENVMMDDDEEQEFEEPTSTVNHSVEALQELRRNLQEKHGDDPLEASLAEARTAKRSNANTRRRKSRATAEHDEEDDNLTLAQRAALNNLKKDGMFNADDTSSEDESVDEASIALDDVEDRPVPKKRRIAAPGAYVPPDEGVFDAKGKSLSRRDWTAQEIDAIQEGLDIYGLGKWKEIKMLHPYELRNRNTVQIKDKCRTLQANNLLY